MAEVKLFEVNLNETVNNIKRLEEELKAVKNIYKEATIGSEEFYRAQEASKQLTANLKQQNDALKANTNALGGINTAAKFAEGSYGKLKQQIKELATQKDALREALAGVVGVTDTGVEVRWSTVAGAKQVNKEKVEELLGYLPIIEGKETLRLSVKHNGGK